VSKKTIYRWWPSKGAVVLELIDETATVAVAPPDTGDLAADLNSMLTEVIGMLTPPHNSPGTGVIAEALHDPDLARDLRERIIKPRIITFKQRLRRAQDAGQPHPDADLDVALDLLYGPRCRPARLRRWIPMALAFGASGSLFAWSGWKLPMVILRPGGFVTAEYTMVAVVQHTLSIGVGLIFMAAVLRVAWREEAAPMRNILE
jgi:hypothetical protein